VSWENTRRCARRSVATVTWVSTRSTPIENRSTRRRPGRPRAGEVVADREQLLAAATSLIRSGGPEITMDDIAAAAGVSKPVLYRTLGDKDAFVTALSEAFVDRINASVDAATAEQADPRARFEAAMRACLRTIHTDRHLFVFVNGGPGADAFRRLVDRSAQQMIEQFSTARAAAGRDPLPARTWAYALVGSIHVVATMWLRDDYADIDDVARHLTQMMWPGFSGTADDERNDAP
jgi:AcrR family transcriptional regulator